MKSLPILLLIFLSCYLTFFSYAQSNNVVRMYKSNFKTNLLAPFGLAYEGQVADRRSLLLEFRYSPTADLFDKGSRLVAASEMRFYLDKIREGLRGFYVGPYLRYRYMAIDKQEDILTTVVTLGLLGVIEKEMKLHTFGFGGHMGYQWIRSRCFVLNTFGGIGYNPIVRKSGFTTFETNYRMSFRLGFSLGFAIPAAGS